MTFKEPDNIDDALELISTTSLFLDFWSGRSGEWDFLQLMTKVTDREIWKVIAKCVFHEGISLQDVPFSSLGTQGVLRALGVFCQGIMNIEIPDVYLQHCAGISSTSIFSLIKDAQRIKSELSMIEDPSKIVSILFSRVLAGSL